MKFIHNCPKCNRETIYKTESGFNKAKLSNKLCRVCIEKEKNLSQKFIRNCPKCNIEITYKWKSDYTKACNKNTHCKKCAENSGRFEKNHKLNDIYNNSENNINKLLEETVESFYWLGFIIADGSFYEDTFEIGINNKDIDHLQKFIDFNSYGKIKEKESNNSVRLLIHDRHSIKKVMEKYGFMYSKTHNPINFDYFEHYSNELLTSLLIGITDGDGCISTNGRKSFTISITAHNSWLDFYTKLINKLNYDFKINYINNTNVIRVSAHKKDIILTLYDFIKKHNLKTLNRKWTKIK